MVSVIITLQSVWAFHMVVIFQAAVIVDLTLGPVIQHLNEYIVEPFFYYMNKYLYLMSYNSINYLGIYIYIDLIIVNF